MAGMDPRTGRWTRDGDEILVAVRRAFSTPRATRIMRRYLGVEHAQMLDRPVTPGMLGPAAKALAESLRYEPRVFLNRIAIDAATQQGKVALAAQITVLRSGEKRKVSL